jgi:glycosyltransferase involved in cell wall biosynthesis
MARVCLFVLNNCTVDSRVLRQGQTFANAGHETIIVATHVGDVPAVEARDGFEIRRVPVHYTWVDAYPRLSKVLPLALLDRARTRFQEKNKAAADAKARAAEAAEQVAGAQLAAGAQPAAVATVASARRSLPVVIARRARRIARKQVRRPLRATKRLYLRSKRDARRWVLRKFMLSTRYRQLDRRMAEYAKDFGADLYWANDTQTLRAARAAARARKVPWVYDAHEVIWDAPTVKPLQRKLWGRVERVHVKRAPFLFTVCDPIADMMARRYRVKRPTVLLNCPRLSETQAACAPEDSPLNAYRKPGEKIVLFHGSLSIQRGLEQLIQALAHLPADHRLVVLGHGAFRKVLEEQVAQEGVQHRVTFLDSVPPDVLPSWLAGADVGTIPYQRHGRNHEYSTPNKLFEYMHLGIPIVVNDLPEIRRIVTDVGFGVITDCSDPAAIAKAILEITSDPEKARAMREAARAAAPRYSWEGQEHLILGTLT